MPQKSWYYNNNSDLAYDLNIYHGDESGHVIIYSNRAIIAIDFGIKANKSYSFYLGEELFELSIKFKKTKRLYTLVNICSGSIIPIENQNNYPSEHLKKALIIVVGLIILVLTAYVLLVN